MSELQSEFLGALLAGAIAGVLFFYFAKKKHFFHLQTHPVWDPGVRARSLFLAFGLYIAIFFLSFRYIAPKLYAPGGVEGQVRAASVVHLIIYAAVIFSFYLLCKRSHLHIFRPLERALNLLEDLKQACFAWAIAFPLVLFLQQGFDVLLRGAFHLPKLPEQVAVYFLKMTLQYPLYFSFALVTVILLAPIAEETLFRGFLQSYLRQKVGSKIAIFLTAFIFAFFHFSLGQGISNLPIVVSLFVFASFLGFLYEKERSLAAPIFLHMLFNAVNALELYFGLAGT